MVRISPKIKMLQKIEDEVLHLTASPLYTERVQNGAQPVIGEGSLDAYIMFVGEAPGKNEAMTGRPFCGMSGKVLDQLLAHINLSRDSVYVTNIVKDRPTDNRDPKPAEIELYGPFLDRQIDIIQPRVIATLGRFSMEYVMNRLGLGESVEAISNMHGMVFKAEAGFGPVTIVPLYHPAVAVYNRKKLPELKKDFEVLKKFL
jgi:uracil-DNA glycosylase family 4